MNSTNIGIIWSTGDFSYGRYEEAMRETADAGSIYLSPFIEKVGLAYRASDMAISRSGSGVMMELAAMGVPSMLIPFPYAAMNHQDKNADVFVESGAAIKITNEDAVPEKVGPVLHELLKNPTALRKMSARALESALPDAAARDSGRREGRYIGKEVAGASCSESRKKCISSGSAGSA